MINNKKKFKEKSTYRLNIFLISILAIGFLYVLVSLILKTDVEVIKIFAERELHGRAKKRGAIILGRFLVNNYGEMGVVVPFILMVFGAFGVLFKEIFEYRRLIFKEKLYKQGLVDNLLDDYESYSFFHQIKNIFSSKKIKHKNYPSEKEMTEKLRKNKYSNKHQKT